MKSNDITTGFVRFVEKKDGKVRPLLVIKVSGDEVLVYRITSKYQNKSDNIRRNYFPIFKWREAGLDRPSYIDTGAPAWLPKSQLGETIGSLQLSDVEGLARFLTQKRLEY